MREDVARDSFIQLKLYAVQLLLFLPLLRGGNGGRGPTGDFSQSTMTRLAKSSSFNTWLRLEGEGAAVGFASP